MVYSASAIATYSDYNTVVQWKGITLHNWIYIQLHVSKMAKVLEEDLVVFSGTYESLKLVDKDDNGKIKEMHLYANKYRENLVKKDIIPQYMWKMIISPSAKLGVVYVTVNNPYMESGESYHICSRPFTAMHDVLVPEDW